MPTYLQINANRSRAAMDLAWATAVEQHAQLLLITEPNKNTIKGSRWYKDLRGDAAIGYIGPRTVVNATGAGNGYVWVRVEGVDIYSCYISPNTGMEVFEAFINDLNEDIMRKNSQKLIITGDFNSKSPLWGSLVRDNRGNILGDMLCAAGMVFLNEWGVYTFIRNGSGSTIDVTAVSEELAARGTQWRVLEEQCSMSPHLYIVFEVEHDMRREQMYRWIQGPIDEERLADELRVAVGEARDTVESLIETVGGAYRRSTRRVRTVNGQTPYWWTANIANLRAEAVLCRRTYTRTRGRRGALEEDINRAEDAYRTAKKNLRVAIVRSKKMSWETMVREVEDDVYGQGYKIVIRGLKVTHPPLTLTKEGREEQIRRLFPEADEQTWERTVVNDVPPFTMEELIKAAGKLKNGKAPGRDGIPAEAIKVACKVIGDFILRVLNGLLRMGRVPLVWKQAKVVLIEKERKQAQQLPAFRPLCLTDAGAKLYEHLVLGRILEEMENGEGLSEHQHGFRKERSTVGAVEEVLRFAKEAHRGTPSRWCLVVFIDVKNAFNTAVWDKIIAGLEEKGISGYLVNVIKDYLTDRVIFKDRCNSKRINIGVPQGSVLGPTLWNIMYDGILRIAVPSGVRLVAYADDLAMLVADKDIQGLVMKANRTIELVGDWLSENGLQMAPEKTEAIILKYGRRNQEIIVNVGESRIEAKDNVKYLGIILDTSVSFGLHIRTVAGRAERAVAALSRLMPNIGGPGEGRRRVLCSVAHSIMLYGAPIWAEMMRCASYRKILQSVQRKMALRICRAYRTVSYEAVTVVASVMPIHLMALERKTIYCEGPLDNADRRAERSRVMDRWQEEWINGTKGAWTRKLIRDVRLWVSRKHGTLDFHLTQVLTGHGAFKSYTFRIGKTEGELCLRCGQPDTAEHAIFYCKKFEEARAQINDRLGVRMTIENMIELMLQSMEKWEWVRTFAGSVMREKEIEERGRRE